MQRFSEQIPWVLVQQNGVALGAYCEVCHQQTAGSPQQIAQFAQAHANHQGNQGHLRLGDAVAAIAKPIAQAFGRQPCTPCEARRRALNTAVPNPWRR